MRTASIIRWSMILGVLLGVVVLSAPDANAKDKAKQATIGDLDCTQAGQIAKWDGVQWGCANLPSVTGLQDQIDAINTTLALLQTDIATNKAAIAAEVTARMSADTGHTNTIQANANNPAVNATQTQEIVGVMHSAGGGIEDNINHYRTIVYNLSTKILALRAERRHGLDPFGPCTDVTSNCYWWCLVGNQVANADIQDALDTTPDDNEALDGNVGYNQPLSFWFRFKFDDVHRGVNPFLRIWVRNDNGIYMSVDPAPGWPVAGWLYGDKGEGFGKTGRVFVGLSHKQLRALLQDSGLYSGFDNFPLQPQSPAHNNFVLVDLHYSETNLAD